MGNKETIGYTCLAHKLDPGLLLKLLFLEHLALYTHNHHQTRYPDNHHMQEIYICIRTLHHALETYGETLIKLF